MPAKKKLEKTNDLRYIPIGVTRWNLCQKLAKLIYKSEMSEAEIMKIHAQVESAEN